MNLDWLKKVEIADGEKNVRKPAASKEPIEGDIAIHKNGSIYYSKDFEETLDGQFLDFVFLTDWLEAKAPEGVEGLFVAVLPEGTGKASIRDKFNKKITFVEKELIPALSEKLDVDVEELGVIELKVAFEHLQKNENGIYHFQKRVTTGDFKDTYSPLRRENIELYPVEVITDLVVESTEKVPEDSQKGDQKETDEQSEIPKVD